jgi:hypothetical protein
VTTNVQNTSKGKASADFLAAFSNLGGGEGWGAVKIKEEPKI